MSGTGSRLTERMLRAARLDVALYEEVEADAGATGQALWVVVIAALADGVGWALGGGALAGGMMEPAFRGNPVTSLIYGALGATVSWVVWSYVTYWIGTRVFNGRATPGQMLRAIAYAQSPRVLNVVSFIPLLGGLVRLAVTFWLLLAGIVAIRQALDVDTGRAIATAVIGWLAMIVASMILGFLAAVFAVGARLLS